MSVQLENRLCPICGNNDKQLIGSLAGNSQHFNKSYKFELSRCNLCDLIYLSTIPPKSELDKMYTMHKQFTSDIYNGEHANLALEFYNDRINLIIKRNNFLKEHIKTLEIGSGKSWISKIAKRINENFFTVAQDITNECVDYCTWVDKYYVGNLEEVGDSLQKHAPYNIISMTHVFEHLTFPIDVLKFCNTLLDENGVIFITAPHKPKNWRIDDPISIWEKWSYNHVPGHLNYYNEKSIQKMAEKSGLKIIYFDANAEEGQALECWLSKSSK